MTLDTRNPRRLPAHRRRDLELARADLEAAIFGAQRYCSIQSALAIPNEAGASFRADTNTALQANATFQAGASAPGTTYADQYWYDTTNQVLKKRNQANSAWFVVGTRDEAFVLSRSSNTILGLSDFGKMIVATGTFTQTFAAVATLGDGWYCFYRNDGSGVITLDPNASETIDGAVTLALYPGESCRIACNGSLFKTSGLIAMGPITNSLGADVLLNNTANYFDGPSVAQGAAGTWFVTGTVTLTDNTSANAALTAKLWDGTSVIASAVSQNSSGTGFVSISLSGFITNPAGNLRISVKDPLTTNGRILFNQSGNSKDSTITAIRIR